MYLEVEEGDIERTWKDNNIVYFWKICDLLSNQIIKYKPKHHKYEGDANTIPATHQNQAVQDKNKDDEREKIGML